MSVPETEVGRARAGTSSDGWLPPLAGSLDPDVVTEADLTTSVLKSLHEFARRRAELEARGERLKARRRPLDRSGRRRLAQLGEAFHALEAEVAEFLAQHPDIETMMQTSRERAAVKRGM